MDPWRQVLKIDQRYSKILNSTNWFCLRTVLQQSGSGLFASLASWGVCLRAPGLRLLISKNSSCSFGYCTEAQLCLCWGERGQEAHEMLVWQRTSGPLSLPGSTLVLLRGHHVHNQLSYCSTSWCLGGFRVPGIEQGPPSHMQTL